MSLFLDQWLQDDVETQTAAFADTGAARLPLGREDLPPAPGLTVMERVGFGHLKSWKHMETYGNN